MYLAYQPGVTPDDVLVIKPNAPPNKPGGNNVTNNINTIAQGAAAALQIYNQQRLANENMERAARGLPPLDYSDVPGLVPTMQFGVEEQTRNSGMMLLALGVGAILLLNMRGGGRRAETTLDLED